MSQLTRLGLTRFLLFLVYSVNTATCQVEVEGFIGDSVLLPCIYSGDDPLPALVTVFWRDKDDSRVLDIIKNQPDLSTQNKNFKGRVFSFPELYEKRNFSIVMQDVRMSDSGPYECHILKVDFLQKLTLTVSGKRVEVATTRPGSSGAATQNSLHMILLSLPLTFLFTSFI